MHGGTIGIATACDKYIYLFFEWINSIFEKFIFVEPMVRKQFSSNFKPHMFRDSEDVERQCAIKGSRMFNWLKFRCQTGQPQKVGWCGEWNLESSQISPKETIRLYTCWRVKQCTTITLPRVQNNIRNRLIFRGVWPCRKICWSSSIWDLRQCLV